MIELILDFANSAEYLKVVILAQDDRVSSLRKYRIILQTFDHVKGSSPNIVLIGVLTHIIGKLPDMVSLIWSEASWPFSNISPIYTVVILPDDEGDNIRGSKDTVRNSVEPHPLISEGVTVKDSVVLSLSLDQDYVPSLIPLIVKSIRYLRSKGIVAILIVGC